MLTAWKSIATIVLHINIGRNFQKTGLLSGLDQVFDSFHKRTYHWTKEWHRDVDTEMKK